MNLPSILADFTPAAAGIWTLVLMLAGVLLREVRENRKLSDADKQARRQGYEAQVKLLTAENRAIGNDLRELREEYDRYRALCQQETDGLRSQIIALEFDIAGLRRRTDNQAIQLAEIAQPERLEDMAELVDALANRSEAI